MLCSSKTCPHQENHGQVRSECPSTPTSLYNRPTRPKRGGRSYRRQAGISAYGSLSLVQTQLALGIHGSREVRLPLLAVRSSWYCRRSNKARNSGQEYPERSPFPRSIVHDANNRLCGRYNHGHWRSLDGRSCSRSFPYTERCRSPQSHVSTPPRRQLERRAHVREDAPKRILGSSGPRCNHLPLPPQRQGVPARVNIAPVTTVWCPRHVDHRSAVAHRFGLDVDVDYLLWLHA